MTASCPTTRACRSSCIEGCSRAAQARLRAAKTLCAGNGWSGGWRGGVYPYHHYHSTAHEALGIVAGSAKVRLGGDSGTVIDLHAGGVVGVPAGVPHKGEAASPDLLIVGAYPGGRGPDMRVPGMGDRERVLANIITVPLPATDPVGGRSGPLLDCWHAHLKPADYRQAPL